ncbi:hypothetical protein N7493_003836 [Penicillium malachiteum]|uniref:High-affinity iron permease n=1 Tax=Penicillium malachiteum TaxID=1324776 RepID=A0AAD6HQD6_9EURO|nr:hypothetical protein N7493_003836 [Penicillium malachiteum]
MVNVFAVQVFFIVFRECLEAIIIVSVLLSFLKQCLGQPHQDQVIYKKLRKQFMITVMGLALLRINKTKQKWRVKIEKALVEKSQGKSRWMRSDWGRRYAMFILLLITTMREGVEAVVFVGGVSLGYSATAFHIPVVTGIITGLFCGWLIYRGGNVMSIQIFLIAAEEGSGAGSYNILETVWHVNCCNPETDNGWDVFQAILGWQNTGTYGSIISYNVYWIFIIGCVAWIMYSERTGRAPLAQQFWSLMTRVPGLKTLANKKLEGMDTKDESAIRQINSTMFNDETTVEVVRETVEPNK